MTKEKHLSQYFKNDLLTTYVCIFIFALSYLALKNDFSFWQKATTRYSGESIGKVAKVDADVRKRNSTNVFWTEVRRNDRVAIGDRIFVGPNSNTVINFSDGKSIVIGANSLIKFNTQNKNIKLSLEYGSIKSSNLPETLVLDDCGRSIKIQADTNSDLEIGKTDCGKIQVKSTTGSVKINNKQVAPTTKPVQMTSLITRPTKLKEKPKVNQTMLNLESLNPAEIAKITASSLDDLKKQFATVSAPVIALPEKPLLPPELVNPTDQAEAPVATWLTADTATQYLLEYADNPAFDKAQSLTTSATSQILNSTANKIYYRLKSQRENQFSEYSKIGTITITRIVPKIVKEIPKKIPVTTPVIDPDYTNLTYFFQETGNYIDLKFQAEIKESGAFKVEISKSTSFAKILKSYSTTQTSFTLDDTLPVGRYYWRVRAENGDANSDWSKIGVLEIIPGKI